MPMLLVLCHATACIADGNLLVLTAHLALDLACVPLLV